MDNQEQVADILLKVEIQEDWDLLARILREPLVPSAFRSTLNSTFYQTLQRQPFNLLDYLRSLNEHDVLALKSNSKQLALCYLFGGLQALEYLLMPPETHESITAQIKLFAWTVRRGHIRAVNRLIEIDMAGAQGVFLNVMALSYAAKYGHLAVVNRLLEIPVFRAQVTAEANECLRWAARNGHLMVVNRLLEIPEVRIQSATMENDALRWAARLGRLEVVKRLLEIDCIKARVTANNNEALRWAADCGQHDVVNLLLELIKTRQSYVEPYCFRASLAGAIIKSGFIRALWLDLHKSGALDGIQSLTELESQAQTYLTEHVTWMNPYGPLTNQALIAGLKNQVLASRLYGYLNYVQLETDAPNKRLMERSLNQDWTEKLNQFINLPKSLRHFEDHKQIRLVASRCLKARAHSAQVKRDAERVEQVSIEQDLKSLKMTNACG